MIKLVKTVLFSGSSQFLSLFLAVTLHNLKTQGSFIAFPKFLQDSRPKTRFYYVVLPIKCSVHCITWWSWSSIETSLISYNSDPKSIILLPRSGHPCKQSRLLLLWLVTGPFRSISSISPIITHYSSCDTFGCGLYIFFKKKNNYIYRFF